MTGPHDRGNFTYERFKPVLLQNKLAQRLLLFDATKGLVWSRDIQGYTTEVSEPASGEKVVRQKSSNPFVVKDIACSLDGAYTLVLLSPLKVTAETGMRLIVFDKKGKLISQTQLVGVQANALYINGSRNSYLLSTAVFFEDGKPFTGNPISAYMLVRSDGTIAGLFTKADGSFDAGRVDVSDDDAIAVSSSGFEFTLR